MNIFQIWDDIGRTTPFAVRRDNWTDQYYTVVERIECEKLPYGKAFGYPTVNGSYSSHYEYDSKWKKDTLIPGAGSYQWSYVENVDLISYKKGLKATIKTTEKSYALNTKLYFGKYRGLTIEQIFRENPSYLEWLIINHKEFFLTNECLNFLDTLQSNYNFSNIAIATNALKIVEE